MNCFNRRPILKFITFIALALILSCSNQKSLIERKSASNDQFLDVILVGNNWDGTVDIFNSQTYERIKKIDVVPDYFERVWGKNSALSLISKTPFRMIALMVGEGNHQLVDDMFMDKSGQYLMASRPSFSDIVKIDVSNNKIVGRVNCQGFRSDHAAISPDGKYFLVSCTTAHKVFAIDVEKFEIISSFHSGEAPHENTFFDNGNKVLHANIANVATQVTFRDIDWNKISSSQGIRPNGKDINFVEQPIKDGWLYWDALWLLKNRSADQPLFKLGEEYKEMVYAQQGKTYQKKIEGSAKKAKELEKKGKIKWKNFSEYKFSNENLKWLDNEFKGDRHLYITEFKQAGNSKEFKRVRRIDMGKRLYEYFKKYPLNPNDPKAGKQGQFPVDKAIRPMAIYADEEHIIFQISFFHGFFKYRLPDFENENDKGEIVNMWKLPIPAKVKELHSWEYQLNSAHHGIAINKRKSSSSSTGYEDGDVDRACVAMTMSGYAAIVNLDKRPDYKQAQGYKLVNGKDYWLFPLVWDKDFDPQSSDPGKGFNEKAVQNNPTNARPYWATESEDGQRCFVSVSQVDKVFVINFGDSKRDPFIEAILSVGENQESKRVRTPGTSPFQVPSLKYVQKAGGERLSSPIQMKMITPMKRIAETNDSFYRKKGQFVQRGALYKKDSYTLGNLPFMMSKKQRERIMRYPLSHPQRIRNAQLKKNLL